MVGQKTARHSDRRANRRQKDLNPIQWLQPLIENS